MNSIQQGIYYKTYGKNHGYALILLHGYLESSESWNNFAELFADEYFVVCIDLPGHGKSELLPGNASMESFGKAVIEVADHLDLDGFELVGHSMGGYLLMSMLENYPERLNSAVLLHSTCYSDSDEKKANRDREIELVKNGKKDLIVQTNIPRLYATSNLEVMKDKVQNSISIASGTSGEGIIYALNAMKGRPDRSHVLANTKVPILLVGGRHDNLIPFETMEKMKALSPGIKLVCLENSGHMGYIEEPENAARELKKFFNETMECL